MSRARGPAGSGDAGFSLIEVVIAMVVMMVVMAVFTTSVLLIYGNSGTAQSIATTRSQLSLAFQRLDRELRYSSWIATPGTVGTARYVEFASSDAQQCLQLRLETEPGPERNDTDGRGVLQLIRWRPGAPPAKGAPGQTLASQLVTDGADPFQLLPAGVTTTQDAPYTPDFQVLRIRLTARTGRSSVTVNTSFTALNTSRDPRTTHVCGEGRPS